MKYQPNRNYVSNDCVMTPEHLAKAIVEHFKPSGKCLEPCKGTGNFLKYLPEGSFWCELSEGKDFFDFNERVDWIITNPPFSKMRAFLNHSLELADNIVFLVTINHLWTKARLRDIFNLNFGIKEICLVNTPKEFPQTGFQLGCIYLKKGYTGDIRFSKIDEV